jgi:parvulin-like peptidyl-prolyl isomerase
MTLAEWKSRLVELFAPQQVIRAEVADRISVSEKDMRDYYDAHAADFDVPAQATVREIVLKSVEGDRERKRAVAEAVRARVAAVGADFAAVAAEVSEAGTKTAGGLLGTVKKGDLAAPLEAAAFSVPVGEVSAVIDADYGFHILKIDARTDAAMKPFEDVKGEIESKIQNDRLAPQAKEYLKKAWSEATIWVSPKYQARLDQGDGAN